MTKQELFNKAIAGLAAQGFKRAWDDDRGGCSYRAVTPVVPAPGVPEQYTTLKCFVGHLIPDELYIPKMDKGDTEGDGVSATKLMERFPEVVPFVLPSDLGEWEGTQWLSSAQSRHDAATDPEMMKADYRQFAQIHGLQLPPELQ